MVPSDDEAGLKYGSTKLLALILALMVTKIWRVQARATCRPELAPSAGGCVKLMYIVRAAVHLQACKSSGFPTQP